MKPTEQKRFDALYAQHLRGLKLHGYSASTIDVYSRAVRRLASYYDCAPDRLSVEQLEIYFAALVDSHSWATVRVDRNGLQFFWKYVLKQDWQWLEIIKVPKIQSLPDILTPREVERLTPVVPQWCWLSRAHLSGHHPHGSGWRTNGTESVAR
jgi:site-specific recombinase XerD